MIENLPNADELERSAFRLYYSVWSDLMGILSDFELSYVDGKSEWPDEWREYLDQCQQDFRHMCALLSNSNELFLKSIICRENPIILLLNGEIKFKSSQASLDFSDLRTLDAVDLPGAVNNCTNKTLSENYINSYHEIRKLRNLIIHTGTSGETISIEKIIDHMIVMYLEFFRGADWLGRRLEAEYSTRFAFFHDGRHASAHAAFFDELPFTFQALTKSRFKKLLGFEKSKRRYFCSNCLEEARTKWSDFLQDEYKTATLTNDPKILHCHVCNSDFAVLRKKCGQDDCRGNVKTVDDRYCHSCGLEG